MCFGVFWLSVFSLYNMCIIAGRNEVFLVLVLRDVLCCGVLVLSKCFVFLYIVVLNWCYLVAICWRFWLLRYLCVMWSKGLLKQ